MAIFHHRQPSETDPVDMFFGLTLFVLLSAATVYGFVRFLTWVGLQKRDAWQAVAAQLGMDFHSGGTLQEFLVIHGVYKGIQLTFDTEVHGSGRHRSIHTRASTPVPLPRGLTVRARGWGWIDRKGLVTDYPALDAACVIQGHDLASIQRFFAPTHRQEALIKLVKHGKISDGLVIQLVKKLIKQPTQFVSLADRTLMLAQAIAAPQD